MAHKRFPATTCGALASTGGLLQVRKNGYWFLSWPERLVWGPDRASFELWAGRVYEQPHEDAQSSARRTGAAT